MEFAGRCCTCELPAPLFAVVSSVIVPAGGGTFLPGLLINHVDRNTSDATGAGLGAGAGVGLGDGDGRGEGEGIGVGDGLGEGDGSGVGVGLGCILWETEPQPARNSNNPVKRIKVTVRKKPSWNLAFIQEGELI